MAHVISDSISGTFVAGVGVITPTIESTTQVEPIVGTLEAHARLTLSIPRPQRPALSHRTVAGLSFTAVTPAIVKGRPKVPRLWGKMIPGGSALAGVGHLRGFADPDPVWGGSSWTTPPPDAPVGSNFIRWSARQLPSPGGSSYLLGSPSSLDGTSGIASGKQQWSSTPGSDFSIPWQSAYPFKPTVQSHIHYGMDGSTYTETAGVHFTTGGVTHMWADFGTILTPPFTILLAGVVTAFRTKSYWNWMFDAGENPNSDLTAAQRADIYAHGVRDPIALTESYGYRTGLRVGHTQVQAFNDVTPTTKIARVPYAHTIKPKVFSFVVDGSNSLLQVQDVRGLRKRAIRLTNHGAQRLMVMGRRTNILSPLDACAMVVFEVRAWDKALSSDQLDGQYQQLASTWKYHSYK